MLAKVSRSGRSACKLGVVSRMLAKVFNAIVLYFVEKKRQKTKVPIVALGLEAIYNRLSFSCSFSTTAG